MVGVGTAAYNEDRFSCASTANRSFPVAKNSSLTLIIPGFLPDFRVAASLAQALEQKLPPQATILKWFATAQVLIDPFDVDAAGADCHTVWWLRQAGFPERALRAGQGIGPLLGQPRADHPCWIIDLAHVQVGRDGLVMTDPDTLALGEPDGEALLEAARPLLQQAGVAVTPLSATRWQAELPPDWALHPAALDAVVGQELDHWWPKEPGARAWRRVSNEIQMTWHAHPVNAAREQAGLAPINALWLYGGAPPWTPVWHSPRPNALLTRMDWLQTLAARTEPPLPTVGNWPDYLPGHPRWVIDDFIEPARSGEWDRWLDALAALETRLPAISQALKQGRLHHLRLVLPAADRILTLDLVPRPWWLRWLPQPHKNWKSWWNPAS